MPLWQAPEAWLQLLINDEDFAADLPKLMSANWAMHGQLAAGDPGA
jgi:hypothetical protein